MMLARPVAGVALIAVFAFTVASAASGWIFTTPLAVTPTTGPGVFHHLESSGRSNIAVSGRIVAVAWEDNRDGTPRARVAFRRAGVDAFGAEQKISGNRAAYEPVIVALGDGRFIIGWEEDDAVWARTGTADALDPPRRLSRGRAGQIHIAVSSRGEVQAVWSERAGRVARIMTAELRPGSGEAISVGEVRPVDPEIPARDQQYPVVAWPRPGRLVFIWEDRRHGHTAMFWNDGAKSGPYAVPRQLNEVVRRQTQYGAGTGVARPVVAVLGPGRLAAAWMDKRNFEGGYDVYAAFSEDDGRSFGKNQKVQDSFGDASGQWHAAIAANTSGTLVVAWDDDRDETADIWMAVPQAPGWSENQAIPGASGPGQQRSPAIALEDAGQLHLAWVEEINGGTRLRYARGHQNARTSGR